MPQIFDIAILTVPRTRPFVHKTMASLIQADDTLPSLLPIYFFIDSDQTDFLKQYEKIAKNIPLGAPELEIRKQWTDVRLAVLYNYWRSLHHFHASEKKLLVCEDDISFAPAWIQKIAPILDQIETEIGNNYILTLYSPYDWPKVLGEEDKLPYVVMKKIGFYGTQAVIFSSQARVIVEKYLWEKGIQRLAVPTDLLVRDCCIEEGIPILSLKYSLVQHEGFVTTGCTGDAGTRGFAHQSPTFLSKPSQ